MKRGMVDYTTVDITALIIIARNKRVILGCGPCPHLWCTH